MLTSNKSMRNKRYSIIWEMCIFEEWLWDARSCDVHIREGKCEGREGRRVECSVHRHIIQISININKGMQNIMEIGVAKGYVRRMHESETQRQGQALPAATSQFDSQVKRERNFRSVHTGGAIAVGAACRLVDLRHLLHVWRRDKLADQLSHPISSFD